MRRLERVVTLAENELHKLKDNLKLTQQILPHDSPRSTKISEVHQVKTLPYLEKMIENVVSNPAPPLPPLSGTSSEEYLKTISERTELSSEPIPFTTNRISRQTPKEENIFRVQMLNNQKSMVSQKSSEIQSKSEVTKSSKVSTNDLKEKYRTMSSSVVVPGAKSNKAIKYVPPKRKPLGKNVRLKSPEKLSRNDCRELVTDNVKSCEAQIPIKVQLQTGLARCVAKPLKQAEKPCRPPFIPTSSVKYPIMAFPIRIPNKQLKVKRQVVNVPPNPQPRNSESENQSESVVVESRVKSVEHSSKVQPNQKRGNKMRADPNKHMKGVQNVKVYTTHKPDTDKAHARPIANLHHSTNSINKSTASVVSNDTVTDRLHQARNSFISKLTKKTIKNIKSLKITESCNHLQFKYVDQNAVLKPTKMEVFISNGQNQSNGFKRSVANGALKRVGTPAKLPKTYPQQPTQPPANHCQCGIIRCANFNFLNTKSCMANRPNLEDNKNRRQSILRKCVIQNLPGVSIQPTDKTFVKEQVLNLDTENPELSINDNMRGTYFENSLIESEPEPQVREDSVPGPVHAAGTQSEQVELLSRAEGTAPTFHSVAATSNIMMNYPVEHRRLCIDTCTVTDITTKQPKDLECTCDPPEIQTILREREFLSSTDVTSESNTSCLDIFKKCKVKPPRKAAASVRNTKSYDDRGNAKVECTCELLEEETIVDKPICKLKKMSKAEDETTVMAVEIPKNLCCPCKAHLQTANNDLKHSFNSRTHLKDVRSKTSLKKMKSKQDVSNIKLQVQKPKPEPYKSKPEAQKSTLEAQKPKPELQKCKPDPEKLVNVVEPSTKRRCCHCAIAGKRQISTHDSVTRSRSCCVSTRDSSSKNPLVQSEKKSEASCAKRQTSDIRGKIQSDDESKILPCVVSKDTRPSKLCSKHHTEDDKRTSKMSSEKSKETDPPVCAANKKKEAKVCLAECRLLKNSTCPRDPETPERSGCCHCCRRKKKKGAEQETSENKQKSPRAQKSTAKGCCQICRKKKRRCTFQCHNDTCEGVNRENSRSRSRGSARSNYELMSCPIYSNNQKSGTDSGTKHNIKVYHCSPNERKPSSFNYDTPQLTTCDDVSSMDKYILVNDVSAQAEVQDSCTDDFNMSLTSFLGCRSLKRTTSLDDFLNFKASLDSTSVKENRRNSSHRVSVDPFNDDFLQKLQNNSRAPSILDSCNSSGPLKLMEHQSQPSTSQNVNASLLQLPPFFVQLNKKTDVRNTPEELKTESINTPRIGFLQKKNDTVSKSKYFDWKIMRRKKVKSPDKSRSRGIRESTNDTFADRGHLTTSSEGEVDCQCSLSIGEVHECEKTARKQDLKMNSFMKKQDGGVHVASRHRYLNNNVVSYYISTASSVNDSFN